MTHSVDTAREAARRDNGQFGAQARVEDTTVDLNTTAAAPGPLPRRIPAAAHLYAARPAMVSPGDVVWLGTDDPYCDPSSLVRVTSTDGDPSGASIEFDADPDTIAIYSPDERLHIVDEEFTALTHDEAQERMPTLLPAEEFKHRFAPLCDGNGDVLVFDMGWKAFREQNECTWTVMHQDHGPWNARVLVPGRIEEATADGEPVATVMTGRPWTDPTERINWNRSDA